MQEHKELDSGGVVGRKRRDGMMIQDLFRSNNSKVSTALDALVKISSRIERNAKAS
jgi:hypothetical protein